MCYSLRNKIAQDHPQEVLSTGQVNTFVIIFNSGKPSTGTNACSSNASTQPSVLCAFRTVGLLGIVSDQR